MHNPCVFVATSSAVPEISVVRRQNVMAIYKGFVKAAVARGETPKGLEQEFAAALEVHPSMWSQIKAGRPVGDRLAHQIEQKSDKPKGWLDELHEPQTLPTPAEEAFVLLAREVWRTQNAKGKRELTHLVRTFVVSSAARRVGSGSS